jgi:hypothetical protein
MKFVPTVAKFIPVTALRKRDEGVQGYYIAAAGVVQGWRGAGVFRSLDEGQTWSPLATLRTQSVMGRVMAVSEDASVVTVRVLHSGMLLEGHDESTVEAGANRALIGSEVFSFAEADLVAANTYELRGLLRGRRGTQPCAFKLGDSFTLLNQQALARIDLLDERRGAGLYLVVSQGQKLTDEPPQGFDAMVAL